MPVADIVCMLLFLRLADIKICGFRQPGLQPGEVFEPGPLLAHSLLDAIHLGLRQMAEAALGFQIVRHGFSCWKLTVILCFPPSTSYSGNIPVCTARRPTSMALSVGQRQPVGRGEYLDIGRSAHIHALLDLEH